MAQNTFPEFLVCGVVPVKFQNATEWNMVIYIHNILTGYPIIYQQVVLGYDANVNQEEAIVSFVSGILTLFISIA